MRIVDRIRAWLAVAVAAVLLAGCYDLDIKIEVDAQGQAKGGVTLGFDPEMQDVFKVIEYFAKNDTDEKARLIDAGLCNAFRPDNPHLPMPLQFTSRQYAADGKFFCALESTQTVKVAEINPMMTLGVLNVDSAKPRELALNFNLERLPDLTPFLGIGIMSELQKRQTAGQLKPGADPDEAVRVLTRAMIASNAIAMRGRKVRLAVTGQRVVATNGIRSADGRTATFEFSADEFARMILDKDARAGKKYSLTLAY
jgi:hypothetical protein